MLFGFVVLFAGKRRKKGVTLDGVTLDGVTLDGVTLDGVMSDGVMLDWICATRRLYSLFVSQFLRKYSSCIPLILTIAMSSSLRT